MDGLLCKGMMAVGERHHFTKGSPFDQLDSRRHTVDAHREPN